MKDTTNVYTARDEKIFQNIMRRRRAPNHQDGAGVVEMILLDLSGAINQSF